MRRRRRTLRSRPMLTTDEVVVTASLGDVSGNQECRALLVRIPEQWTFNAIEDGRLVGEVETIVIPRRHPDGIPAGRYLRLPVDSLIDPWGRVSVGLEFETPSGYQHALLTVQTRDEDPGESAADPQLPTSDGVRLDTKSVLDISKDHAVFFVEGGAGDIVDLTDDTAGEWSRGDNDGTHTLYIRHDRAQAQRATLAVRNGVAVKLP